MMKSRQEVIKEIKDKLEAEVFLRSNITIRLSKRLRYNIEELVKKHSYKGLSEYVQIAIEEKVLRDLANDAET